MGRLRLILAFAFLLVNICSCSSDIVGNSQGIDDLNHRLMGLEQQMFGDDHLPLTDAYVDAAMRIGSEKERPPPPTPPTASDENDDGYRVRYVYHEPGSSLEEKLRQLYRVAQVTPQKPLDDVEPLPPQALKQQQDDDQNSNRSFHPMGDVYFLESSDRRVARAAQLHQGQQAASGQDQAAGGSGVSVVMIAIVAGCSVVGLVGLAVAGACYYKLQKNAKATSAAEYPAYGVTGPAKEKVGSPGDRKLAHSAQMYHFQHQKQQMLAMEKANGEMKQDGSDDDSEEEVEGDYTVYECPGLAPPGEMEVRNPLFRGDDTPVTPTSNGEKGQTATSTAPPTTTGRKGAH